MRINFFLVFSQLLCLNLSNNRLYRLDDLADIVNKVPNLKILNLSQNEVWLCSLTPIDSQCKLFSHVSLCHLAAEDGERAWQTEGSEAGGTLFGGKSVMWTLQEPDWLCQVSLPCRLLPEKYYTQVHKYQAQDFETCTITLLTNNKPSYSQNYRY